MHWHPQFYTSPEHDDIKACYRHQFLSNSPNRSSLCLSSGASRCPGVSPNYWLRVSLTPQIRARGAELADFFGYRLNGPKDVLSQH